MRLAHGEPDARRIVRHVLVHRGEETRHVAVLDVGQRTKLTLESSERFAGRLETIPAPDAARVAGPGARRARVEAILASEAAVFERMVADAPEQWWTVFFPIWPDLAPAPRR